AWQVPAGGGWSGWGTLGAPAGVALVGLAVGRNADGRLEAFAIGTDAALWHAWQLPAGGGWSGWDPLGAPPGVTLFAPAAGRNADGRLEVFAVGDQDTLWHRWQVSPGGGWDGWASLGTPPGVAFLQAPAVGQNADGRLEVFAFATAGDVWHIWQDPLAANGWPGWESLGGEPANAVGVGKNAD